MTGSAETIDEWNPQAGIGFKIGHFVRINDIASITGNHLQTVLSFFPQRGYQARCWMAQYPHRRETFALIEPIRIMPLQRDAMEKR